MVEPRDLRGHPYGPCSSSDLPWTYLRFALFRARLLPRILSKIGPSRPVAPVPSPWLQQCAHEVTRAGRTRGARHCCHRVGGHASKKRRVHIHGAVPSTKDLATLPLSMLERAAATLGCRLLTLSTCSDPPRHGTGGPANGEAKGLRQHLVAPP